MTQLRSIYFYYLDHMDLDKRVDLLIDLAKKNSFEIVDDPKDASIIISVGGDGAFVQAVRTTGFRQDCLYAGITGADESALYCDFNLDNIKKMFQSIEDQELEIRRFPVIDVQVNGESSFHCLNEVSIRSTIIKTIVIDVRSEERRVGKEDRCWW